MRVLEVAQFTFVPAAGAVLADWGADVIKVEHAETGDAQRGLSAVMGMPVGSGSFAPSWSTPTGANAASAWRWSGQRRWTVLHELIRTSDVFLTNFLPAARRRLGIELDDVRKRQSQTSSIRGDRASGHRPRQRERRL